MPLDATERWLLEVQRPTTTGHYPGGGVACLLLHVSTTGTRSPRLRLTVGNTRREIGLGPHPGMSLALARDTLQETRNAIANSIDPEAQRADARQWIIEQLPAAKALK